MVYLPTFTIEINEMYVNKPYMDPMGIYIYVYNFCYNHINMYQNCRLAGFRASKTVT